MGPLWESLAGSATRVLLRIAFTFEPLAPAVISVFVNQGLRRYKEGNIVSGYKTRTKRLGRYHYLIEIHLDLTGMQAVHLATNLSPMRLGIFGRWYHG
ncbi:MAG: hypothetical protein LBI79_08085 [Nitrososphaerota archaeon]|nr:hypothetical protein [Nitrososphaerota archaeon]